MKYITLVMLLFSSVAFGKTITEDGVAYACSPKATCEEKLRYSKKEVAALKAQLAAKPKIQERLVYKERSSYKKNRISVMLGHGATGGLKYSGSTTKSVVEAEKGLAVGAQYQRLVTERVSLGLGGFSNGLVFVGAGYDF